MPTATTMSIDVVEKDNTKSLIDNVTFTSDEDQLQQAVGIIKEMLSSKLHKPALVEELLIIDAIQRLGLEFYFQDEINAALAKHQEGLCTLINDDHASNLHDVALLFRLLRQHGYNLPSGIFDKFTTKNGEFDQELRKDLKGLMSLFEASHLRIPGDLILEYASEYSRNCLQMLIETEPSKAGVIRNTLISPYYKSLPGFMAKNNLNCFESSFMFLHDINNDGNKWITLIQDLARISINMAQMNHQNEITQVSRWWNQLQLTDELKLARSQPEKWHMRSLACLPGPHMADHRLQLTKAISFIYIIDDIFDVYGTLEELILFTEAVNKWEFDNVTGLPKYMKVCLKALFDTTDQISQKFYDNYGYHPKQCFQKVWTSLCNAHLVDAKWVHSGHTPTSKEYLQNGIANSGVGVVCAYFLLLGGRENNGDDDKETFDSFPDTVSLVGTILRLWNDLGRAKDGNENGRDGSYLAFYLNEQDGCSTETAKQHMLTLISDAWKSLNQTCLSFSPYRTHYKTAILNLARMVPVFYSCDDNHRLPCVEKHMKSLLMSEQTEQDE